VFLSFFLVIRNALFELLEDSLLSFILLAEFLPILLKPVVPVKDAINFLEVIWIFVFDTLQVLLKLEE
jgi:hypothetical protein